MKKIVIISSYNEACGPAFYSKRLVHNFSKYTKIKPDVIQLDLDVLQSLQRYNVKKADEHVASIIKKIQEYDAVCLQFEPGLYGIGAYHAYKRVYKILKSHKNPMMIVHGFNRYHTSFKTLSRKFVRNCINFVQRQFMISYWKKMLKYNIKVLCFSDKDRAFLTRLCPEKEIYTYPITYFAQEEVKDLIKNNPRSGIFADPDKKYISVFGFLSPYKGHFVALKALDFLPKDYVLVIAGAEHPRSKDAVDKMVSPYIRDIIKLTSSAVEKKISVVPEYLGAQDIKHFITKNNIKDRVFFTGPLTDEEMLICCTMSDYIVLPYISTSADQSASGPAVFALEFQKKSLFSDVPVFRNLGKFFKGAMAYFIQGNSIELAHKIQHYDLLYKDIPNNLTKALDEYNPKNMVKEIVRILDL